MTTVLIAVIMTCHNRRDTTLTCLAALFKQELPAGTTVEVYLVDDESTDGSGEAVSQQYPSVKVIRGSGNLYWCGGMRIAWAEAMKKDYDYYLWLNDDTKLYPDAIQSMILTSQGVCQPKTPDCIFVGSICDPIDGSHAYGGLIQTRPRRALSLKPIRPENKPRPCVTFNGNCVMVPRIVAKEIGNLSAEFTHGMADTDYGLRARQHGFKSWVSSGYAGTCQHNYDSNLWADPRLSLIKRWRIFHSPKGMPHREWIALTRRHAGYLWPLYWLKLWLRFFFPGVWDRYHRVG